MSKFTSTLSICIWIGKQNCEYCIAHFVLNTSAIGTQSESIKVADDTLAMCIIYRALSDWVPDDPVNLTACYSQSS